VRGFGNAVGLGAHVRRELVRSLKIVNQVVWPPIITTVLYVTVFGLALGRAMPTVQGVSYASYLIPGLIMLQTIDQTYSECSASVFQGRFLGSIQELLVAPLSAIEIVTGFVMSAIVRALAIAFLILAVGYALTRTLPHDWALFALVIALVATLFGSLGLVFGLLAEKWDHVATLQTFVITPLVFVGGVFTSTQLLPPPVRAASYANPMTYFIAALRDAFTGGGDIPLGVSLAVLVALAAISLATALRLVAVGYKLRT